MDNNNSNFNFGSGPTSGSGPNPGFGPTPNPSFNPGPSSNAPNQPFPSNLPPSEENYFASPAGQEQYQPLQQQTQFSPGQFAPDSSFQPTAPLNPSATPGKPKSSTPWSTFQITIVIVLGAAVILFLGLFIWMLVMWSNASSDVQGQVNSAVAAAIKDNTTELENRFAEEQKYPYKTLVGPADYGELTFEYPKTWSAYIEDDSTTNGEYLAYLNPDSVNLDTINALIVNIVNTPISQVTSNYEKDVSDGSVTLTIRPINGNNANIYTGNIAKDVQGIVAIFKIRDKTAIIQTDAMIFQDDFYRLLDTIKYNA